MCVTHLKHIFLLKHLRCFVVQCFPFKVFVQVSMLCVCVTPYLIFQICSALIVSQAFKPSCSCFLLFLAHTHFSRFRSLGTECTGRKHFCLGGENSCSEIYKDQNRHHVGGGGVNTTQEFVR